MKKARCSVIVIVQNRIEKILFYKLISNLHYIFHFKKNSIASYSLYCSQIVIAP